MNVLLVLGGGIGNIVQATPAIKAIAKSGHTVDLKLHCNSSKDVARIFNLECIRNVFVDDDPKESYDVQLNGPFTPGKVFKAKKHYKTRVHYAQHIEESKVYEDLAIQIGINSIMENAEINVGPHFDININKNTVAIYPGSKHNWAMKRWDKYDELSKHFDEVILVGTKEDIKSHGNPAWIKNPWDWPKSVKMFNGSLQQVANVISQCKFFIGNDGGLSHVAAATGVPTFVIFGPSSLIKNKPHATNSHTIALDIPCRPCQFEKDDNGKQIFGENKASCPYGLKCMKDLEVDKVLSEIKKHIEVN